MPGQLNDGQKCTKTRPKQILDRQEQMYTVQRYKIGVHPPRLQPSMSSLGYGNPRYNSMLAYGEHLLLSSGAHLRQIVVVTGEVLTDQQIGHSQIFQIMENHRYILDNLRFILVINFEGLLSLLSREDLQIVHQFHASGKQIRHAALTATHLCVSCELNEGLDCSIVDVFELAGIQQRVYKPVSIKGHLYYPEYHGQELVLINYHDPNPKGRPRKETVLFEKLPVTNRILKLDALLHEMHSLEIKEKGEILCAAQSNGIIYYLHCNKRVTAYSPLLGLIREINTQAKQIPHLLEPYSQGVAFASHNNCLKVLQCNFQQDTVKFEQLPISSPAIGGNLSLKFTSKGIYAYNENGMHYYDYQAMHTHTLHLFDITNCGIVLNKDASLLAVADFGGTVQVFDSGSNGFPKPKASVTIGLPIRSLAWCRQTDKIVFGCVGGGLYSWVPTGDETTQIQEQEATINILRCMHGQLYAGNSNGEVFIYDIRTLTPVYSYKAHHPMHYTDERERELFGSMHNYAEIWSLAICPVNQQIIVSSSQDQSERVIAVEKIQPLEDMEVSTGRKGNKGQTGSLEHEEMHRLTGHQLAVTSIDWKLMAPEIGQVYASCSDDKLIRIRNPNKHFQLLFEIETSTIKEWHTLTYLALEPLGRRVAVGSQNGYLFIFDLLKKELVFGEKVHLGGIEGMDWVNGKLCTCSSDLCINILQVP